MAVEGKNEVARSLLDLQPTAILELYKLYPDTVNSPSTFLSFHGGSVFGGNVIWQGIQYLPIPVESEGFGVFGDGTLPRPKIKVSNNNKIVTYFLGKYKDFKNARVFRKKVFLKHLDDVNFDGNNPFGLANSDSEISEEKYYIGQKVQENKSFVEFELNLPLDLDNFDINHRTVNAKYCYWQYRGLGCRYADLPVEMEDGEAFTDSNGSIITLNSDNIHSEQLFYQPDSGYSVGDVAYIEDKSIILDRDDDGNPLFHRTWYVCSQDSTGQHPEGNPSYWLKDGCNKKIEACQKRFSSKSLVKKFIGEEEATSDYLNLHRTGEASFATTDPNVTGVFGGDSWTLSIWVRGQAQYQDDDGSWYNPSVFATHELPRTNSAFNPDADGTFGAGDVVTANLHFSSRTSIDDDKGRYLDIATTTEDGAKSKLTKVTTKIASQDKFHCLVFRKNVDSTMDVLVDPQKNQYGTTVYSSKSSINIDDDTDGVNLFSLFSDKTSSLDEKICFGGDIGQVCLWSGKLSDDEVSWVGSTNSVSDSEYYLTDNGLQKTTQNYCDYIPLKYDEATGYLAPLTGSDKLVFWYDMQTGLSSSKLIIQDESHNSYDITGFGTTGEFEKRTIEYTKGKFEEFVANQNAQFELPFGGFPGTDGFDYKALGSQNI